MRRFVLVLGLLVGAAWLSSAPPAEAQGCVAYSSPLQGYLYGYCYGYPFDSRLFPVNVPSGANATTFALGTLGAVYPNNALQTSPQLNGVQPSIISASQTGDSLTGNPNIVNPVTTRLSEQLPVPGANGGSTAASLIGGGSGIRAYGPTGLPAAGPAGAIAPGAGGYLALAGASGLETFSINQNPGLEYNGFGGYGYPFSGYPFHSGLTVTYNGYMFPIFGWPGSFGYPYYGRRGFDPSATLDQKWQSLDAVPLPAGGWQLVWTVGTTFSNTSHEIFQCPQVDSPAWACRPVAVVNAETRTFGPVVGGYTYLVRSSGYGGYTGTIGWGGGLEAESTRLPLPLAPPGGWPEAAPAPPPGGAPTAPTAPR